MMNFVSVAISHKFCSIRIIILLSYCCYSFCLSKPLLDKNMTKQSQSTTVFAYILKEKCIKTPSDIDPIKKYLTCAKLTVAVCA